MRRNWKIIEYNAVLWDLSLPPIITIQLRESLGNIFPRLEEWEKVFQNFFSACVGKSIDLYLEREFYTRRGIWCVMINREGEKGKKRESAIFSVLDERKICPVNWVISLGREGWPGWFRSRTLQPAPQDPLNGSWGNKEVDALNSTVTCVEWCNWICWKGSNWKIFEIMTYIYKKKNVELFCFAGW